MRHPKEEWTRRHSNGNHQNRSRERRKAERCIVTCIWKRRSKIYATIAQRKGGIKWKYVAEQFLYYTRRRVILLLSWLSGKESVCQCLSVQEAQVQSLGQKDLWRRKWQPIPVFLPGKSHGQRGLAGYTQSMGSQRIERDLVTKQQQESMKLLERKAW